MVRLSSEESHGRVFDLPKKKGRGLIASISIMVDLWAKRADKLSRKTMMMKTKPSGLPVTCPKQLLKTITDTAVTLVHKKKNGDDGIGKLKRREKEWGDGGVWQKAIMMGDKCQPLDFSGVICYDCHGKQLNPLPSSPAVHICPLVILCDV